MTARIAALLLWTWISDSTVECSIEGVSLIQSERRGVAAIHRWSQWMVKTHGGDRDGGPLLVRRENGTMRGIVHPIVQSSGSQSAISIGPSTHARGAAGFLPRRLTFQSGTVASARRRRCRARPAVPARIDAVVHGMLSNI